MTYGMCMTEGMPIPNHLGRDLGPKHAFFKDVTCISSRRKEKTTREQICSNDVCETD